MAMVLVDEDDLNTLMKQNSDMKEDVRNLNEALQPVFSFVGNSRPVNALMKAAKRFVQHPEELHELGQKVSTFINKYSPQVLSHLNNTIENGGK